MARTAEEKIDECRAEVDGALSELHRRIESIEATQQMIHKIYERTERTDERVSNLVVSFSSYAAKQEDAISGFPDNDPDGHRRAHEAMIALAQRRARFYDMALSEATRWGMLGVLGFLAASVWFYVVERGWK